MKDFFNSIASGLSTVAKIGLNILFPFTMIFVAGQAFYAYVNGNGGSNDCAHYAKDGRMYYQYMIIKLAADSDNPTVYAIPSNALPSSAIPSNALPSSLAPKEAIPSNGIPSNAIPSNAIPANFTSMALPSSAIPSNAVALESVKSIKNFFNTKYVNPLDAIPSNIVAKSLLKADVQFVAYIPPGITSNLAIKYMASNNISIPCTEKTKTKTTVFELSDKLCEKYRMDLSDIIHRQCEQQGFYTKNLVVVRYMLVENPSTPAEPPPPEVSCSEVYPTNVVRTYTGSEDELYLYIFISLDFGNYQSDSYYIDLKTAQGGLIDCEVIDVNRLICTTPHMTNGASYATFDLFSDGDDCLITGGEVYLPYGSSSSAGPTPTDPPPPSISASCADYGAIAMTSPDHPGMCCPSGDYVTEQEVGWLPGYDSCNSEPFYP